jgi:hypothetical protein
MTSESNHHEAETIRDVFGVWFNAAKTVLIRAPETLHGHYTIPDGVTTIGKEAFFGCWELTSITMPASMTTVEYGAFWNCGGLTSVNFSPNVAVIGDYAFWDCNRLTGMTLPDRLMTIGDYAFWGCSELNRFIIPSGVKCIGNCSFAGCGSPAEIIFCGDAPTISEYAFYWMPVTAYYPANNPTWTEEVRQDYGGSFIWKCME